MRRAVPPVGRVGDVLQAVLIMLAIVAITLGLGLAVVVLFQIAIAEPV